jgi:hypothetical protein
MTYFHPSCVILVGVRQENPSKVVDWTPPKNHHGFVYVRSGNENGVPIFELRKPTPVERSLIVGNYIRAHSGEPIKIPFLSSKLGVSDRTIQSIIQPLISQGAITSVPSKGIGDRQGGNILTWTWKMDPVPGSPTMEDLYARKDSYGFRSYTWDDYKINPDAATSFERIGQYLNYLSLMDIKKRLKRKRDKRLSKNLKLLRDLNVRDNGENKL